MIECARSADKFNATIRLNSVNWYLVIIIQLRCWSQEKQPVDLRMSNAKVLSGRSMGWALIHRPAASAHTGTCPRILIGGIKPSVQLQAITADPKNTNG